MAPERDVPSREHHALALEARALRNEVGGEPAARVDDPVTRHRRIVAVVHRETGETRGPRVTGDHRDHPVGRHAAARDAAHHFIDPLVPLVRHSADKDARA